MDNHRSHRLPKEWRVWSALGPTLYVIRGREGETKLEIFERNFLSTSLIFSCPGTIESQYLTIIVNDLWHKLPKSLERSALILDFRAAIEKSPSLPKVISLNKKYLI